MPTWATDTNFSSGTENGLSTKVEPSAGQIAQGDVAGLAAPAAWSNWWKNKVGEWITYLKNLSTDSDFLGFDFSWTGNHDFANAVVATGGVSVGNGSNVVLEGNAEVNFDTPRSYVVRRGMTGHGNDTDLSSCTANQLGGVRLVQRVGSTDGFLYHQPIDVPNGATITAWRALVTPEGSGSTLTVRLFRATHTYGGSPALDSGTGIGAADTTTGSALETMGVSGLSEVVDNTDTQYVLTFSDPVTPGGSLIEMQVHGYEITYEMTGIRQAGG